MKKLVVLESPYSGDVKSNEIYARLCLYDCLSRGEAPIASHLLYTQPLVLDDSNPSERILGMRAGWAFMRNADKVVVYTDLGTSSGMELGIEHAELLVERGFDIKIEYRQLPDNLMLRYAQEVEKLGTRGEDTT